MTITYFLNHELIDEMTITYAPMLLGEGIPLIGKLNDQIRLEDPEIIAYENDFIQITYKVSYS
jgi:dihydrofolate reductase